MEMFLKSVKEKANSLTDAEIEYWKNQYDNDVDTYHLPKGVELDIDKSLKADC